MTPRFLRKEISSMEKGTSTVKQDALLAAAILAAFRRQDEAEIEDISRLLYTLRSSGEDIGAIDLRRIPGGFYSEDLEILISHYLDSGFADQKSPLKLKSEGLKLLEDIVEDERRDNPEGVKRVEKALSAGA
jgi:hypothetical protein